MTGLERGGQRPNPCVRAATNLKKDKGVKMQALREIYSRPIAASLLLAHHTCKSILGADLPQIYAFPCLHSTCYAVNV